MFCTFLLPSNDVWGKLMFLHLSVILLTGGGLCVSQHAMGRVCVTTVCVTRECVTRVCVTRGHTLRTHPLQSTSRGCTWQGGMLFSPTGKGVCMAGGMHGRGHVWLRACMAGGMHGRGTCCLVSSLILA